MEGISSSEAARRCQVAPSFLAEWREKYLALLDGEPSIAEQPLLDRGAMLRDADLIRIPRAAREHFAENWTRLMEITRATSSTFRQHPVQLFLENSWLTGWLYVEGKLDRGVFAGAVVVVAVLVLTASFLMAGRFHRRDDLRPEKAENLNASILKAADAANQFFKAEGVAEKMRYVRLDDETRALMEDYYLRHSAASIPDASLRKAMPGTAMFALEFEIPSLSRNHLCVVVDRGGEMLVDWETTSIFQEAHLEEIRKAKPQTPVRVATRIEEDSYYNFGFDAAKRSSSRPG